MPDPQQYPLGENAKCKQPRAEEQDTAVADMRHAEIGNEWPDERACRSACCDHTEQPLGLIPFEQLEQKAPEHRQQHEIHHADEDVEDLADQRRHAAGLHCEADAREQ